MDKYILLLILPPVIYLFAPMLHRRGPRRTMLTAVHATLLTYLTLFSLNRSPLIFSDELSVLQFIHAAKEKGHAWKGWFYDDAFIADNFLLIDTSFDPMLVPYAEGDQEDSTMVRITNRKKLADLLGFLDQESDKIDLVVCDILFQETTSYDTTLREMLDRFVSKDKLVVAHNGLGELNPTLQLPEEVLGRATEELHGDILFSHTIHENNLSSLPYLMYRKTNNIQVVNLYPSNLLSYETNGNGDYGLFLNTFIPNLHFSDETRLLGNAPTGASDTWLRLVMNDLLGTPASTGRKKRQLQAETKPFLYNLGYVVTETGRMELAANLRQGRNNKRKIVFIGAFQDAETDVHHTAFGPLHGSVILLNIFYELQQGRHRVSMLYVLMLFAGFWLTTWLLIRRANRNHPVPGQPMEKGRLAKLFKPWRGLLRFLNSKFILPLKKGMMRPIIDFCGFFFGFIFNEERHVWLLLLLVIVADLYFGHFINIMGLAIYLVVFDALLQFFMKRQALKTNVQLPGATA